jgi:integrase
MWRSSGRQELRAARSCISRGDEYNDFVDAIPLYTGFGHERLSQVCFRALVETLAATGMRISEALALNTDSVDLSKGEAVVIGKGNKQRTVFFTERAITWINRYLALRNNTIPPLFATSNGHRLQVSSVQARFRRASDPLFKRTGKRKEHRMLPSDAPGLYPPQVLAKLLSSGSSTEQPRRSRLRYSAQ